jgi:replication factor C small subunit
MKFDSIWCEKYRPQSLDTICLPQETREVLDSFKEKKDIPHLLFVSTPGTGKTSTAKIIVNEILGCDYLYINASDENGIDTIRHKIIGFSQTKSFNGGIKVVILDEADSLTPEGARALRNVMEEYADNTRFILTANYKHKIIDPIQSRCQTLYFNHEVKDVVLHCINILTKEGIKLPETQYDLFKDLIKSHFPDFRKTINELQKFSISGIVNIHNNVISKKFIDDIWNSIRENDVVSLRNTIIQNEKIFQSDYHALLKALLNDLVNQKVDEMKKKEGIMILGHHLDRHSHVIDVEINSFVCIVALSKLFHV